MAEAAALRIVICGLEHSGTTLCADLLRQADGLDGRFELGVLLGASPRDFPRVPDFYQYFAPSWGLAPADERTVLDTDDFAAFYGRLLARSAALRPGTTTLFDKTPRYLSVLSACLARVQAPFVVTWKDPRAIVHSDFQRAGAADFDAWFADYAHPKLAYLRQCYAEFQRHRAAPRVLALPLEELCLAAGASCEKLFAHAGLRFHPRYLALRDLRYPNTRPGSVNAGAPFEFWHAFSRLHIAAIERHFAEFGDWFYD